MNDDDLLNLILGNNADGPSVMPFANAGNMARPTGLAALSSLMEAGVGSDVVAGMLPQRQDTSAALLSPSALAPAAPLYDPNGFQLPEMTPDQAALTYGMSLDQVADIHRAAQWRAATNIVTDGIIGGGVDAGLAAAGAPELAIGLVGAGMDLHDALNIAQQLRDAPGQEIFKRLNESEIQNIPSAARTWLP